MESILVGLQSGILMAKESDKKEGDKVYDSLNGELLYKHKKKQKVCSQQCSLLFSTASPCLLLENWWTAQYPCRWNSYLTTIVTSAPWLPHETKWIIFLNNHPTLTRLDPAHCPGVHEGSGASFEGLTESTI
ncbi:hypothetical protein EMCRGX_G012902 [Ephydatia muelleri]